MKATCVPSGERRGNSSPRRSAAKAILRPSGENDASVLREAVSFVSGIDGPVAAKVAGEIGTDQTLVLAVHELYAIFLPSAEIAGLRKMVNPRSATLMGLPMRSPVSRLTRNLNNIIPIVK